MTLVFYEYAVLRYIHDPLTKESLNIGVLVYSKEAKFLALSVSALYARLSDTFAGFDGVAYRKIVQHLASKCSQVKAQIFSGDWTSPPPDRLAELLPSILIPNDSSFRFDHLGGGLAIDLSHSLESLYARFVTKYVKSDDDLETRNDREIWSAFADEFQRRQLLQELSPKTIKTPTFEYEFGHAWKNERWHPLEPVSLDLQKPASIYGKVSKWMGNMQLLRKNPELGVVYLLVGKSRSPLDEVQQAYANALVNLRNIEGAEIYEDDHAEQFADKLAQEIAEHKA